MSLAATNVWCWRWRGITRNVHVHKKTDTITARAEIVLERTDPAYGPNVRPEIEVFRVLSGTAVAWVSPSPGAECNWSAGSVTQALKSTDAFISLHIVDRRAKYRRSYWGAGGFTFDIPQDVNCSTVPGVWTNAMFFDTGGTAKEWFVSADGQTIQDSTVIQDDDQFLVTSEWHFTAEREP